MARDSGSSTPVNGTSSSAPLSSRTFTLQAVPSASSSSSSANARTGRAARRLYIASEVLRACKISASDPLLVAGVLSASELKKRLSLQTKDAASEKARLAKQVCASLSRNPRICLAFLHALEKPYVLDDVAAGPGMLQGSALEYHDIVSLSPLLPEHTHEIDEIHLKLLPAAPAKGKGKMRAASDEDTLAGLLQEALLDLGYCMQGQVIEVVQSDGIRRNASVARAIMAGKPAPKGVYVVNEDTELILQESGIDAQSRRDELIPTQARGSAGLPTGYEAVGGLDRHIAQIRELVELPLTRPDLYSHFGLTPPRGILLHGPPGTGKTLLASSIAASLRLPLLSIDGPSLSSPYHGETEQRLREIFEEAQECAPSIIVIDEVDALVPAREDAGEVERRVVATLLTLMDGLGGKEGQQSEDDAARGRVIVIAATNRPNAIDQALRRPGRFDKELEIGVPDAAARLSILKVLLRRTPHQLDDQLLLDIAGKTHGYVGADLSSLIHSAGLNAIRRVTRAEDTTEIPVADRPGYALLPSDLHAAMQTTRPSALRSVFLETPQVSWSDIGGQSSVKQKLQEVIEWPLRHPDTFKRLGVTPPRGILLYGPPGCSKTLIARALASSAAVNFISLKGPEVFNKYVGESERAIRETFRKARAAAPCIVFLDEIDVIAGSRDGEGDTSDRVLTTLLTEMDGIDELNGVTVLAATNRPEVIDSALMRPGRLDRILYVSPPDTSARIEILRVNFRRMAVNEDVDITALADMTEGCSGAEVVSICQDAAFNAMNEDLEAENIRMKHFVTAAESIRRRITPDTIAFYESWRDSTDTREI